MVDVLCKRGCRESGKILLPNIVLLTSSQSILRTIHKWVQNISRQRCNHSDNANKVNDKYYSHRAFNIKQNRDDKIYHLTFEMFPSRFVQRTGTTF